MSEALLAPWRAAWPGALAVWSRVVKLSEPRWCLTPEDERREGLSSAFAMIRLDDHAVVISLRKVVAEKLADYATEILAHEIGHHLYAPGDLGDHGRCLVRMRGALGNLAREAPLISNLYTDLLINDRLQRQRELRMVDIYRSMATDKGSNLWRLYMRIYENLWGLPRGALGAQGEQNATFELDASLGARLVRSYARDWLGGASGFAALCFPYLMKDGGDKKLFIPMLDAGEGLGGDSIPGGLAELDEAEAGGGLHPLLDPRVNGLPDEALGEGGTGILPGKTDEGDRRPQPRPPTDYKDLMRALGVKLSDEEILCQYYKELALPHLVPFPERLRERSTDPLPESLDVWDTGSPMEEIDWFESLLVSPVVVPGVTTVRRVYGTTEGADPEKIPLDLYIGIDCSGSMSNPAQILSYAIVAGAVLALSALRGGARVKVVLSGEPGSYTDTGDFTRDEAKILRTLTAYLGTGYTFGIPRLAETFTAPRGERPAHILIVTDSDIFGMLSGGDGRVGKMSGWEVAKQALDFAGGGGTYVLRCPANTGAGDQARMRADGWDVFNIASYEELVAFAAAFARKVYQQEKKP